MSGETGILDPRAMRCALAADSGLYLQKSNRSGAGLVKFR